MPRPARALPTHILSALLGCGLATAGLAAAPGSGPAPPAAPLAHSAQLDVTAREDGQDLELTIRRVADHAAVVSPDLRVSIEGRGVPVSARGDGRYVVHLSAARGSAPLRIQLEVPHDGIRELLDGRIGGKSPVPGNAHGGLLGSHTQMAWWILNVIIVLVAALALSKRRG